MDTTENQGEINPTSGMVGVSGLFSERLYTFMERLYTFMERLYTFTERLYTFSLVTHWIAMTYQNWYYLSIISVIF